MSEQQSSMPIKSKSLQTNLSEDRDIGVLDLGSNSFHMLVAKVTPNGDIRIIDRMKEHVKLAAGLDKRKILKPIAQERALQTLRRFGNRLRSLGATSIRIVATDTFRKAKNGEQFLLLAQQAVGFPIEIISGLEEARLIFRAVSYEYPCLDENSRMIIDIGGGSTELVIGSRKPVFLTSRKMGCVSFTERFFPNNKFTMDRFEQAKSAAKQELLIARKGLLHTPYVEVLGTSGTIRSISNMLTSQGFSEEVTLEGLHFLAQELEKLSLGSIKSILGLSASRSEVIAGGISILTAIFEELKIKKLMWVRPALREGVLFELVGQIGGKDIREKSIRRFAERLNVDTDQVTRVQQTMTHLLQQKKIWQFQEETIKMIRWAIELHEIGMFVAFSGYHRHGNYLISNADLSGFSQQNQKELAALVRFHRGKINYDLLHKENPFLEEKHVQALILLRIAIRLTRLRQILNFEDVWIETHRKRINLYFSKELLANNPLLQSDLEKEKERLAGMSYLLHIEAQ